MSIISGPNIKSDGIKLLLDPYNSKSITSENLLTYSEDFTQSSWQKSISATIIPGANISPDGNNTATKLVLGKGYSGDIPILNYFNVASYGTYTESLYVKYAGVRYAYFWWDNGSGNGCTFEIDLLTGATRNTRIGNNSYYTSFVTGSLDVGNGWYRIYITAKNTNIISNVQVRLYISNDKWISSNFGTPSTYSLDESIGVYIWGWQAENSNFPTSYIKTTGSVITRNAIDLSGNNNNGLMQNGAVIDYANNSSYYFDGSDNWIVVTTTDGLGTANSTVNMSISIWAKIQIKNSYQHLVGFRSNGLTSTNWGNFYMLILDDGAYPGDNMETRLATLNSGNRQLGTDSYPYYNIWTNYTITASGNIFKYYVNGTLLQTDTGLATTTLGPNSSNFSIGRSPDGSFVALGNISDVRFYSNALSDTEVSNLYLATRIKYGV